MTGVHFSTTCRGTGDGNQVCLGKPVGGERNESRRQDACVVPFLLTSLSPSEPVRVPGCRDICLGSGDRPHSFTTSVTSMQRAELGCGVLVLVGTGGQEVNH